MNRFTIIKLIAAFAVLVEVSAFATSVISPAFDEMVARADLIFTGRMTTQRCEWRNIDGKPAIFTLVTFDVQRVHKGTAGRSLELQFVGGTIGDTTLEVASIPKFKPGERSVLFVEKNGINASPVVGFYHGRFGLRSNNGADDSVTHHDGDALADVADVGKPKGRRLANRAALSHREFSERIVQSNAARKAK